ncbi:MAG: LysR family transcriptional regulator [Gammaproteobacteria bacterium]
MRVNLTQLETFYWIARLGSMRRTAQHLHLTQPTISARVHELEAMLGTALFERTGSRVRLTLQGELLLDYAERMLALADELTARVGDHSRMQGLLRLGVADSFALLFLPDLLAHLERRYPQLKVDLQVGFSMNLSRSLNERSLNIAFLTEPDVADYIRAEPLGVIQLAWVAGARGLPPQRPLKPADLVSQPIITNPKPSHLYTTTWEWFASAGLHPERISTCNSLTIITRLVMAGTGVSILPSVMLQSEMSAGSLRLLATAPEIRPHRMYVAYQEDEAGPGIDAVVSLARELIDRSGALASA